jgi:hypothetical protein
MSYYVPGLGEKDADKTIRSLMQAHEKTATNEADIAALTATVAGLPNGTVTSVGSGTGLTGGPITTTGSLAVSLSTLTNSLSGDVALPNTSAYAAGPQVAQGTSGTWFASGSVLVTDTAAGAPFFAKLWDGTTVIASGGVNTSGANFRGLIALSGLIASPAGDIRISVANLAATSTGGIRFNNTSNSKDSTLTVIRIA